MNHVSPDKLGAGSDRDRDITDKKLWLAVTNMTFMTFHILGMSSSRLTFIFFRGVGIPPTRYMLNSKWTQIIDFVPTSTMVF
jgi:hypothetical protein